jgi:hypothetical protein
MRKRRLRPLLPEFANILHLQELCSHLVGGFIIQICVFCIQLYVTTKLNSIYFTVRLVSTQATKGSRFISLLQVKSSFHFDLHIGFIIAAYHIYISFLRLYFLVNHLPYVPEV